MESLKQKIDSLAREHLTEAYTELETLSNGRVFGHIVSPEFNDLSMLERRLRFKEIYTSHLSEDEISNLSLLLYYTPEEWDIPHNEEILEG